MTNTIKITNKRMASMMLAVVVAIILLMVPAKKAYAADFTTAKNINPNGIWTDTMYLSSGASEYFKFDLGTAGMIDVSMMSYLTCDNGDYNIIGYLELYNSNFEKIESCAFSSARNGDPKKIDVKRELTQGTYYVRVKGSAYDVAFCSGNYKLCVSFENWGVAANLTDSSTNPVSLNIETTAQGSLLEENEQDWYKVIVTKEGQYQALSTYKAANDRTTVDIYDANFSFIGRHKEVLDLNPGTYYVRVTRWLTQNGSYTLRFNRYFPQKNEDITIGKYTYRVTCADVKKNKFTVSFAGAEWGMTKITIAATVNYKGTTYKVTGIESGAILRQVKKVTIKSTYLTSKSVKSGAFNRNYKVIVKVPKSKKAAYKKFLFKKGLSKISKIK